MPVAFIRLAALPNFVILQTRATVSLLTTLGRLALVVAARRFREIPLRGTARSRTTAATSIFRVLVLPDSWTIQLGPMRSSLTTVARQIWRRGAQPFLVTA